LEETRNAMNKEVDNHNIENQKIREEFEGMLRSFDKLIEENRKKKIRIEELLVNKALLEKTIADLEKDVAENLEEIKKKDSKIDTLEEKKRELEMQTGIIPELKEQISIVIHLTFSLKKTLKIWKTRTESWMQITRESEEMQEMT
jgi:uncharacterized coiled-coil protein SlyX